RPSTTLLTTVTVIPFARDGSRAQRKRYYRDRRQQGGRRPASYRRHDQERRGESGGEYGGGKAQRRLGFALNSNQRGAAARHLLHYGGGRPGGVRGHAAHEIPGAVPSPRAAFQPALSRAYCKMAGKVVTLDRPPRILLF